MTELRCACGAVVVGTGEGLLTAVERHIVASHGVRAAPGTASLLGAGVVHTAARARPVAAAQPSPTGGGAAVTAVRGVDGTERAGQLPRLQPPGATPARMRHHDDREGQA